MRECNDIWYTTYTVTYGAFLFILLIKVRESLKTVINIKRKKELLCI